MPKFFSKYIKKVVTLVGICLKTKLVLDNLDYSDRNIQFRGGGGNLKIASQNYRESQFFSKKQF